MMGNIVKEEKKTEEKCCETLWNVIIRRMFDRSDVNLQE